MTNLQSIQSEVLFNTFDDAKYRPLSTRRINDAQNEVARRIEWGWAMGSYPVNNHVAFTSGSSVPVGMPAFGWNVFSEVYSSNWSVSNSQPYLFDRLENAGSYSRPATPAEEDPWDAQTANHGAATLAAPPGYYRTNENGVNGQELILPDGVSAVTVYGFRRPRMLVSSSDECELPPQAIDALILYTRAQLYLLEDDVDMHGVLMQAYQQAVTRIVQSVGVLSSGGKITPGSWGDGMFGG